MSQRCCPAVVAAFSGGPNQRTPVSQHAAGGGRQQRRPQTVLGKAIAWLSERNDAMGIKPFGGLRLTRTVRLCRPISKSDQ
jgi:hypothetical protein